MDEQAEKEAYQQKLRAKLDEWQANIDKLNAQARQAQADARIDYEKQLEQLRAQRDEMASQLEKLQKSQTEAFSDLKSGVDKAWDEMATAMKSAWNRFG